MSYLGRGIDQIDNISTLDNISFSGSTATFNLTQNSVAFTPVSADALQIQIDGVIQSGNYTVSGSTVTFDFTPSGSSVCNGIKHFGVGIITSVSDGAVTTAKLGADSVNGSKIADDSISDEHLDITAITGQTEKTSLVDADKFLISDSADSNALKYVQKSNLPSGGLVLLESIDASNTATVEFTSFPSTYYNYMIYFSNVDFQNNDEYMAIRANVGGASGVRDGGTDYGNSRYGTRTNGNGAFTDLQTGDAQYSMINFNNGIAVMSGDWEIHGYVHIWNPNSSHYKMISHRTVYGVSGNNMSEVQGSGVVYQNGALTRLQFMTENGENYSGNFRLYGIKK